MQRGLHIILAFSLLALSWFELAHELDIHAHQPDQSCEVCLLTGHLGHGATGFVSAPVTLHVPFYFEISHYVGPTLDEPFRLALSQRGPPSLC